MARKPDWRSALKVVMKERIRSLGPHPGRDKLVAYHAGLLAKEDAKDLQTHLVLCNRCRDLLLDLEAFAADASSPAANLDPDRRRRAFWSRWWPAVGAAAAILFLVLFVSPLSRPIPRYGHPVFSGNLSATRGEGSDRDTLVFARGDRFSLKLQPETTAGSSLTARAYLRRDKRVRSVSTSTLEIDSRGVVTLQGVVGRDVKLPVGESELLVCVARHSWALPSRETLSHALDGDDSSASWFWSCFKQRIRVLRRTGEPSFAEDDSWVEFAGCRVVVVGPVCILEEHRKLTLLVMHDPEDEIWIDAGGWWDSYVQTRISGGSRYRIEVGRSAREVVVESRRNGMRSVWVLEVAYTPEPEWRSQAQELYDRGAWKEARSLLKPHASAKDLARAGPALGLLARIERRSGRPALGDAYFRRAVAAHRETGTVSEQIRDAAGLSYYLIQERRFSEAGELLDSLDTAATRGVAESRYYIAYFRSLLAERTGNLRAARRWMLQAARSADLANMVRRRFFAQDLLARQLAAAGLLEAAQARYAGMQRQRSVYCEDEGTNSLLNACDCARHDVNRAWVKLLAQEARLPAQGREPSELLNQAERVFLAESQWGGETCVRPDDLPNVRLNLALAALHTADPAKARDHLDRAAVDLGAFPRLALWKLDIEARIWLAVGQPRRALDLYEELSKTAELRSSPEAAWRASFGRATALEFLGRTDDALEACLEGERLLTRESLLVPAYDRGRFVAQRERASRFCLDLLLRAGRGTEALNTIRRSAARALTDLHIGAAMADRADRRQWEKAVETRLQIEAMAARIWRGVPIDREARLREEIAEKRRELRRLLDQMTWQSDGTAARDLPLRENVALLGYHPLPEGWAAIAADRRGVTVHRIAGLPPETDLNEIGSLLLEPLAERIAGAKEVRIIAYGALKEIDFHALPWAGGILLEHAPVVYHFDLSDAFTGKPRPSQALVVSGPGLLKARAEAREVRRRLQSRFDSRRVVLLEGAAASGEALRRLLGDVDLFHYAGHASYDEESLGWDSHLVLAEGLRLTVDDILFLPRAPRWVVLSGCETGQDTLTTPAPNIGLAQAFLVAGTEFVVAADAGVSDEQAYALTRALYRHWDSSTPIAVAMQRAQLELRRRAPESGWSNFRVLGR